MLMPAGFGSGWVSCSELFTLPLHGPSTCLLMQDNTDYSGCPRDDSLLGRDFETSITWDKSYGPHLYLDFIYSSITLDFSVYFFTKLKIFRYLYIILIIFTTMMQIKIRITYSFRCTIRYFIVLYRFILTRTRRTERPTKRLNKLNNIKWNRPRSV